MRLVENLQLTIILFVALLAFVFVLPFGVFRLLAGDYVVAVSDFVIVAAGLGSGLWAWKTGDTVRSGLVVSFICTIGAVVVTFSRGMEGVLWVFPVMMFVFYLSPPRVAFTLIAGAVAAIAMRELLIPQSVAETPVHLASFLASSLCAAVFSYLFARSNKKHSSQLMGLAAKDPLTGLHNRRTLEKELSFAMSARQELGTEYGMIVVDLDRFKEINDEHGHAEGDRILREFAELLLSTIRASDHAFRYGGDEFVVLIAGTTDLGLEAVCTNILENVRGKLRCCGTPVTVSLGAALQGSSSNPQSWFQRADTSVYRAKEAGRNCYHVAEAEAEPEPVSESL